MLKITEEKIWKMKTSINSKQHLKLWASRKPVSNFPEYQLKNKKKKKLFFRITKKDVSKLGGAQYSALKISLVIYVYLTIWKHVQFVIYPRCRLWQFITI